LLVLDLVLELEELLVGFALAPDGFALALEFSSSVELEL